jgi:hypothetical protein
MSAGANTTYAFVSKWYGQGMDASFNSATQYTTASQPIYDVANGVINFGYTGTGGGVAAINPAFMNLPNNSMPFGQTDSSFSVVTKYWNWANTYNDTQADLISCYSSSNLGHIVFNYNGYPAIAMQNLNYTQGTTLAASDGIITYKYTSRSTTLTNQSYVYQNSIPGTANNSTNPVTFTPYSLSIGNYTSNINTVTYQNTGSFSGTNYFLQAQLYYLYIFNSALTGPGAGTDQGIIEATPSAFNVLPSMPLTATLLTATTFSVTWTAVVNATSYIMYVNSSAYGIVSSGQTITPGSIGPWTINVYAYNVTNNLLAQDYTTYPPTPILYYTFDTNLTNSISGMVDTTLAGTATISTTGGSPISGGYLLTGTSGNILRTRALNIGTNGFSITWWQKLNSTQGSNAYLWCIGDVNTSTYLLCQIGTGSTGSYVNSSFGGGTKDIFTVNYRDNVWRHVAITVNSTGVFNSYVNGVNITVNSAFTAYPFPVTAVFNKFMIGNDVYNGAADSWAGNAGVDDFRIYNGVLNSSQINLLYNKTTSGIYF